MYDAALRRAFRGSAGANDQLSHDLWLARHSGQRDVLGGATAFALLHQPPPWAHGVGFWAIGSASEDRLSRLRSHWQHVRSPTARLCITLGLTRRS